MIKACIFDLDGTLTDTLDSLEYSVNETLKEMKLESISREQTRKFVGNGARYLMERALEVSGDEKKLRIEEAMEIYGRVFSENCTYHVTPYEGIDELLEELKKREIGLAVVSNKPHQQAVEVVHRIFGTKMFDWVQGQSADVPRKPDPAGPLRAAEHMKVLPEECLYIGDSEVDVITAKAAEMVSVGVTWGFRDIDVLTEAGANHLIKKANELIQVL